MAAIEQDFGGEIRKFDISPIGRWRAVEARCGVGIGKVYARLYTAMPIGAGDDAKLVPQFFDFNGDDIREVLFQGLQGGGESDADASKLMRTVFDDAPKAQFIPLATRILSAWLFDLAEGEAAAPKMKTET